MSCPLSSDDCPYRSRRVSEAWDDADRARFCIRCGRPAYVASDLHRTTAVRRAVMEPVHVPSQAVHVPLKSRMELVLAGSQVVQVTEARVDGVDVSDGYAPAVHERSVSFSVAEALPDGAAQQPVFCAPHLYWIRGRRILRADTRPSEVVAENGERRPMQHRMTVDTVVEKIPSQPTGPVAWGRCDDQETDPATKGTGHLLLDADRAGPSPDRATYLAVPCAGGIFMASIDAYSQSLPVTSGDARFVKLKPNGQWYAPVFLRESGHWLCVSSRGDAYVVPAPKPATPDAPADPESSESRISHERSDRDARRVLPPEIKPDVATPCTRVGGYTFTVITKDRKKSVIRFGEDGPIREFIPNQRSHPLVAPTGLSGAPTPFDQGVVWPVETGDRLFYVAARETNDYEWLEMSERITLQPGKHVSIGNRIYTLNPGASYDAEPSLLELRRTQQGVDVRTLQKIDSVTFRDVQNVKYMHPRRANQPGQILLQTNDKLIIV